MEKPKKQDYDFNNEFDNLRHSLDMIKYAECLEEDLKHKANKINFLVDCLDKHKERAERATDRLEMIDNNIEGWQKQMQNPNLSTFVEFVKYAKKVTALNKERKYLRELLK